MMKTNDAMAQKQATATKKQKTEPKGTPKTMAQLRNQKLGKKNKKSRKTKIYAVPECII